MNAIFYTIEKRNNSTASPKTEGTSLSINWKATTDLETPELELQTVENPTGWNFVYLPAVNRYYFIDRWRYDRDVWTAICREDYLLTWKSGILATRAQVLYSSSARNPDLMDGRIAASAQYSYLSTMYPFHGIVGDQTGVNPTGTFVLVAIGGASHSTGTATSYFLDYSQMLNFADELTSPDVWESLKNFFQNPMDAIVECYYIPIGQPRWYIDLSTDNVPIRLGNKTLTTTAAVPTHSAVSGRFSTQVLTIPWQYDDFRRLSPYSIVNLFVPFCGVKPLDASLFYKDDAVLTLYYGIDFNSGAVQAILQAQNGPVVEEWSGNCKVSLPVGQSQSLVGNALGAVAGAATTIGGIMTGNPIVAAHGLVTAISSVITPANQKLMGGMGGSILGITIGGTEALDFQQFRLSLQTHETSDTPANAADRMGFPLFQVRSLSGLSGYCQTAGASVMLPGATRSEQESINTMLDAGIFIID